MSGFNGNGIGGWTDERVDRLKVLWADGCSCSVIAAELGGVTRNGVIGKIHRLGLSKPKVGKVRQQRTPPGRRRFVFPASPAVGVEPFVPAPKSPDHLGLTFGQLKDSPNISQCRYIHGDNDETPYTYCGQPVRPGSSYCGFHHRLCFHKPDPTRRKTFIPARGAA